MVYLHSHNHNMSVSQSCLHSILCNPIFKFFIYLYNRESVDSLSRDVADTDTPINQMKQLITPECYSYKPFQT